MMTCLHGKEDISTDPVPRDCDEEVDRSEITPQCTPRGTSHSTEEKAKQNNRTKQKSATLNNLTEQNIE